MFRVVAVSVRGDLYLMGNPSVHPINPPGEHDGPVPPGVGTTFASLTEAVRYTRRELGPISSYHQVRIVDEAGQMVMRGWRSGVGGTGKRWDWTKPTAPGAVAREEVG
jgi:hypothetical protein